MCDEERAGVDAAGGWAKGIWAVSRKMAVVALKRKHGSEEWALKRKHGSEEWAWASAWSVLLLSVFVSSEESRASSLETSSDSLAAVRWGEEEGEEEEEVLFLQACRQH